MSRKQKIFYIEEENLKKVDELKVQLGFSSGSQVINYLISQTQESQEKRIAQAVRKELEENYLPKERIRWGVQTAEQNSMILLDAMNTILHKEQLQICIPVEFVPSPVIKESQERIKEKVRYFKQKSDERKSKGKD
ncbi:hypothetical protein [uncultured Merdimonas sp.]|uniref:hypothetical protein n=1 Tax=uncultured Merdimonas sp. TaxID=2023269 RepID=UPI00320B51ED